MGAAPSTGQPAGDASMGMRVVHSRDVRSVLLEGAIGACTLAASALAMHYVLKNVLPGLRKDPEVEKAKQRFMAHMAAHGAKVSMDFSKYEEIWLGAVIFPEDIDVSYEDIGGHEKVKEAIYESITLPLERPELFQEQKGCLASPPRGILFYGPSGTGKTMMAKAIARSAGVAFINVSTPSLLDMFLGESEKRIEGLFSLAHKLSPCILFLDEVEAILFKRGTDTMPNNSYRCGMVNLFLSLWDGLSTTENSRVVVLATTNQPHMLDEAALRRLPRAFLFDLPDAKDRLVILRRLLREERLDDGVNLEVLSTMTQGYSGSDITEMCKVAAMGPIRRRLNQERERKHGAAHATTSSPILWSDFQEALHEIRPSSLVTKEYMRSHGPSVSASFTLGQSGLEELIAQALLGQHSETTHQPAPASAADNMDGGDVKTIESALD